MCAGILLCKEFLEWIPHNWCGHSSAALFGIQVLDSKTALSHGCWLDGEKLFMPSIQKVDSPVDITWHSREADYVNESEQGGVSLQIHNWEDLIQSVTLWSLESWDCSVYLQECLGLLLCGIMRHLVLFLCAGGWVWITCRPGACNLLPCRHNFCPPHHPCFVCLFFWVTEDDHWLQKPECQKTFCMLRSTSKWNICSNSELVVSLDLCYLKLLFTAACG